MRPLFSFTLLLLFCPAALADGGPRRVVLIAGPLDRTHPRGTHEYEKAVHLLKHCLEHSPNLKGVRAEVVLGGWPRDERVLERADTIVLVSSGADRNERDHPLLAGDRLGVLGKQMKRGCGLVTIHWTTFVPNGRVGGRLLDWVGGYFDYQSGPPPRHWYSAIQDVATMVRPGDADHPICRGIRRFRLRDEFYYHIRFRKDDARLRPILLVSLPGVAPEQTVAWAIQRADGGRGFGFTGGHYHANWLVPEFRKLVLNAIAWTAHAEVPPGGVLSTPPAEGDVTLVEGKFGKALDARVAPALVPGDERFRKPPLSVECWGRLFGKRDFNILLASDPKGSARHWELYTYAGTGDLSAYLPGVTPAEVRSGVNVCDGRWHHLAMTWDGKAVRLFVDGKRTADQAVTPGAGLTPRPGPLTVGAVLYGARDEQRIGCDGLIEEVRISRSIRRFDALSTAPPTEDAQTIGLWHFDHPGDLTGMQAWTPPPQEGDAAPWEKETDKDWIDARFRRMDTGPFLGATVDYPVGRGNARCYRATAIKVGDKGEATVLFDRGQLRLAAGWTGGFLHHSDRRFGLLNTPTPAGKMILATEPGAGWAGPDGDWGQGELGMLPLPASWASYRGLYLHGKHTVLSYTVGSSAVLDVPWIESHDGVMAFSRTLHVAAGKHPLDLLVGQLPGGKGVLDKVVGQALAAVRRGGEATAAALVGGGGRLRTDTDGRIVLALAPRTEPITIKVLAWHGPEADLPRFAALANASQPPEDIRAWTRPGPGRWGQPLVTRGAVAPDNGPFVIDTLTVPYDNPYRALMFLAGLDFLPNGALAVCTAHGDVWLVKGTGEQLGKVTWKRFATGLYQPLGLKVVDGVIHVLERGQLTRLHDTNGDGEADFYECVNNAWYVGGGEHSFDTGLETDPAGNFYFFKTGDAHTPTGGCLMRISRDGSRCEVFATGFRQPICLAVSPKGNVTGSDQEGNWMPATRIDRYRQGGFYGDLRTHHRAVPPTTFDPPVCWLPREADNSSGGQVWVPEGKLGPLSGRLIHLSYGRCRALLVMEQRLGDVVQGGAVDLGLQFLSGVMRGRVSPRDGHLYVCGLRGWQNAAVRDGCLQRVRYTGKPVRLPTSLEVLGDGLRVGFTCPLDRRSAEDAGNWRVQQWNYHWGPEYGSKRWSVAHPDRPGQDLVPVRSATLLPDGRSIFLRIAGLRPVMQMEIDYHLTAADRSAVTGVLYNTIHRTSR